MPTPRTYRRWTETDEKRLRQLYAEGLPFSVMGELLDRDPVAVQMKANRLRLPLRKHLWTPRDEQTAIDLYEAGASWQDIALEIGRTPAAVKKRLSQILSNSREDREHDRSTEAPVGLLE